jgi:hypothetical protein
MDRAPDPCITSVMGSPSSKPSSTTTSILTIRSDGRFSLLLLCKLPPHCLAHSLIVISQFTRHGRYGFRHEVCALLSRRIMGKVSASSLFWKRALSRLCHTTSVLKWLLLRSCTFLKWRFNGVLKLTFSRPFAVRPSPRRRRSLLTPAQTEYIIDVPLTFIVQCFYINTVRARRLIL